jgi:hypothetical protein
VRGWLAPAWGVGGISDGIEPAWLGESMSELVIWLKPHPADGCPTDADCVWEWVHVKPSSGVSLGTTERWVELTGHYRDPAAGSCHYAQAGVNPNLIADPLAWCASHFVVTAVRDIPAPG